MSGVPNKAAQEPPRSSATAVQLRPPADTDGADVHALVSRCPPLDVNSRYCNLLQCTHFADTCVVAESGGVIVGWVSAYSPPGQPDTLFVWQVAVDDSARGQGLGQRMIRDILVRPANRAINTIATTITPDNAASWRLFEGLAESLQATSQERPWFRTDVHFRGMHPTEHLLVIGPFSFAAIPS